MNDKELADKIVALGMSRKTEIMAGGHGNEHPVTINILNDNTLNAQDNEQFVRDWRVAGALMEKCLEKNTITGLTYTIKHAGFEVVHHNDSLPRAIIGACVEALEPALARQSRE